MPIRTKRYECGKFLEIEIYPISLNQYKMGRKDKIKESRKEQRKLNDKNARKKLNRILNNNFTDADVIAHLTYKEGCLPKSEEEAIKDRNNYLRRVKNYFKKQGKEFKYIGVLEYKDETQDRRTKTRVHHHIVMSGEDRDVLEKLWKKGRANVDRLQENEFGYEDLAKYLTKDPKGKKRWAQSRNLVMPVPKINDNKISKKKVEGMKRNDEVKREMEELYKGFIYTNHEVFINDKNSGTYLYIKMRRQ